MKHKKLISLWVNGTEFVNQVFGDFVKMTLTWVIDSSHAITARQWHQIFDFKKNLGETDKVLSSIYLGLQSLCLVLKVWTNSQFRKLIFRLRLWRP